MKFRLKGILWICLIITLLLSTSGIILRHGNESRNKAVLIVPDYKDFYTASLNEGLQIDDVLERLKKSGSHVIALRETTINDLYLNGSVFTSTLGEYLASLKRDSSGESRYIESLISTNAISKAGTVVVSDDERISSFLSERLQRRLDGKDFSVFKYKDKTIFYIGPRPDKGINLGLGFDKTVLDHLKEKGFEVLLRPVNPPHQGAGLIKEYEDTIKSYGVKYVIFDGSEVLGYPRNISLVESILNENNIITGIIEPPSQVGYTDQKGLDSIIKSTRYAVNRVYITPEKDLSRIGKDDIFYRWLRCIVDRNIRFIYVQPLTKSSDKSSNIEGTLSAVKNINAYISGKGYSTSSDIGKPSDKMTSALHVTAVFLSIVLALLIYALYVFERKKVYAGVAILLWALGGAVLLLVGHFNIGQLLALSATVIYPPLSNILMFRYIKNNKEKSFLMKLTAVLGIIICINALGAYTIVTTLSDIRYTMNIGVYKGVLISFGIPLLLFAVNYISCFEEVTTIPGRLLKLLRIKVSYLGALGILLALAAIVLYLARSGNDSGISASGIEIKVREILEKTMMTRPRFKEFLIGYPAVFAGVYLYHKFKKEILLIPFGIAAVMGSVSIVNSFCHVFTAVEVSAMRTLYGLVLGVFSGLLALIAVKVILIFYDKYIIRKTLR